MLEDLGSIFGTHPSGRRYRGKHEMRLHRLVWTAALIDFFLASMVSSDDALVLCPKCGER